MQAPVKQTSAQIWTNRIASQYYVNLHKNSYDSYKNLCTSWAQLMPHVGQEFAKSLQTDYPLWLCRSHMCFFSVVLVTECTGTNHKLGTLVFTLTHDLKGFECYHGTGHRKIHQCKRLRPKWSWGGSPLPSGVLLDTTLGNHELVDGSSDFDASLLQRFVDVDPGTSCRSLKKTRGD